MTRHGEGSITKQPNGTFRAYWTDANGKQRSKRGFASKSEAVEFLAQKRLETSPTANEVTFERYWEGVVYPSTQDLKPKTRHEYERMWRVILRPLCGGYIIQNTTHAQVQVWLDTVDAPAMQRHTLALLRKIIKQASRDGLCNADICTAIKCKKHTRKPRQILDVADLPAWLDMLHGYRHEARMLVMLGCGLSVSEAYALTPEDLRSLDSTHTAVTVSRDLVDVGGRAVLNDTPKTEWRSRTVILGEPFNSRLAYCLPFAPVTSPSSATNSWNAWQSRKEWTPANAPSDMRPIFATWCAEAGVSDSLVAKAMGHAGTTTAAQHYQRATVRNMRLVADALTAYFLDVCNSDYATFTP